MKQITLLCVTLLLATAGLIAQGSSFYVGARAGGNLSKFKFTEGLKDLYPVSNSVFGLNGGIDAGLQIQGWTLSTGLHYVQKGGRYETENFNDGAGTGFFTAQERQHFLTIPLLLGYRESLSRDLAFAIDVGPSFNVGLGGKIDETTEYFGTDDVELNNYVIAYGSGVNEDYKGLQVGFQISPGLVYRINERNQINFRVTWDIGLSDSFNPRYKNANEFFDTNQGNQLNRSALFTLGYEYHLPFGDRY